MASLIMTSREPLYLASLLSSHFHSDCSNLHFTLKPSEHPIFKMASTNTTFITPKYIYKILPSDPPPPSPLPLALPVSALDTRDNFIHMSTSRQLLGTLRNFFAEDSHVYILRIPYARVESWIKWENSIGKGPEEVVSWEFPFSHSLHICSTYVYFCCLLFGCHAILKAV
jgi:uncharacterized protein (DUF952 family)